MELKSSGKLSIDEFRKFVAEVVKDEIMSLFSSRFNVKEGIGEIKKDNISHPNEPTVKVNSNWLTHGEAGISKNKLSGFI